MGDGEGLVKIEMTDIGAKLGRARQPHQRIEIGAIDVDLAPMGVNCLRQPLDPLLEDTMRGRIGHHRRRQLVGMLCQLDIEIGEVDVASLVGGDDDD